MSDDEDEIDLKIRFRGEVHKLFDIPVGLSNRELLIQIITEICPQELSKIPKLKLANEREISFGKPKFNLKKFIRRFGGGEGVIRGVLEFGDQKAKTKKTEKESEKKVGKIQELQKTQENLEKELDKKKVEVKNLKKRLQRESKKVVELEMLVKKKDLRLMKLLKFKAESEKASALAAKLKKKELAFAEPLFEKHPILLEALAMCSAFYFVKKHANDYFVKYGVSHVPYWRICTTCCEVRRRSYQSAKHNFPKFSNRCKSTGCDRHPFCCMCLYTNIDSKRWMCSPFQPCDPSMIPQEFRKNLEPIFVTQTYENSSHWYKGERAKLLLERKRERKVNSLIERRVPVDQWDDYLSDCKIKLSFSSLSTRLEKERDTFIIIDPLNGAISTFDYSSDVSKERLLKYVAKEQCQYDPRRIFLLSTEGMVCLENKDVKELKDLRYGKNIVPLIWCELSTN